MIGDLLLVVALLLLGAMATVGGMLFLIHAGQRCLQWAGVSRQTAITIAVWQAILFLFGVAGWVWFKIN